MAIADVAEYAHLSDADVERLRVALEAIRRDIEDSGGEKDRAYIRRAIAFQRCLDLAARLVIASRSKAGWGARHHRDRDGQEHREHGTRQ